MKTTNPHPTLSAFSMGRRQWQGKKNAAPGAIFLLLSAHRFPLMAMAVSLLFFLPTILPHKAFGNVAGPMQNELGTLIVNSVRDLGHEETDEILLGQRTDCTTGVLLPNGEPECTLRAAIELHDAHRSEGHHVILFNIAQGLQTILPDNVLPIVRGSVTIDGTSQPGYAGNPLIEINGANAAPLFQGGMANGLELVGGACVVKGLVINSFAGHGIVISGTGPPGAGGHQIKNCYIGTDPTGTSKMGNGGDGIFVEATPGNIIGGTEGITTDGPCTGDCNVIAGNGGSGIRIAGLSPEETGGDPRGHAADNEVMGNFIGVDVSGEVELGNEGDGVHLFRVCNLSVGGADITQRNIISGNGGSGVVVEDLPEDNIDCGEAASSSQILKAFDEHQVLAVAQQQRAGVFVGGNLIGTNVKGTNIVSNKTDGVIIRNKSKVLIGDPTDTPGTAPGNVISGNQGNGVMITGAQANGNQVRGNIIGLNAQGNEILPNIKDGAFIEMEASGNTIGGNTVKDRNIISGNRNNGIEIGKITKRNYIFGNFIGTDLQGKKALPNLRNGILIISSSNQLIGDSTNKAGTPPGNVISGNEEVGISINSSNENEVRGNIIGLNVDGNAKLSNDSFGVLISGSKNMIGGPTDTPGTALGNVISGNQDSGVLIESEIGVPATNNQISGNIIGLNAEGNASLSNSENGIQIGTGLSRGASDNTIGGNTVKDRNIISGNRNNGVYIRNANDKNNIFGNFIGTDLQGKKALPNLRNGIFIIRSSNQLIGDSTNKAGTPPGNVISGNQEVGISINSSNENEVRGNIIGLNVDGNAKLSNDSSGVAIYGTENTIGSSTEPKAGNIISGNRGVGIFISFEKNNEVGQNFIGPDIEGKDGEVGNESFGIYITGKAGNNKIKNNIIKYNKDDAIRFSIEGSGNKIKDPNSIAFNGGLGIDIGLDGPTPNDPGDTDSVQNFPEITSVQSINSTTIIKGTLNSKPNRTYTLEFFSNSESDPSGFGEGDVFIGDTQLTTDGNGDASFDVSFSMTVQTGHFITATATDDTPDGSTSEFSEAIEVGGSTEELADLELEKEVDNSSPQAGEQVTFVVTLKNKGPDAATGIEVRDTPSDSLNFDNVTPSQGSFDAGTGVWAVGSLNAGDSATLTLTATIVQAGIHTNTAEVTASNQSDPDSAPDNNDPGEDDQDSVSVEGLMQQKVVSFTLVNARTDMDIPSYAPLTDGAVIDLEKTGDALNVRANTSPQQVGSVVFFLDGKKFRTENVSPYALAGDNPPGNYLPWPPALGPHTLTAIPYSEKNGRGTAGTSLSIEFEVIRLVAELEVESFTLVNADSDQDIGPLNDGDVIAPGKLNIRANTSPEQVGSVVFFLDGNRFRTENVFPYALAGDNPPGEYFPWTPQVGHHTLTAVPYSKANGGGSAGTSLSISFEVGSALSLEVNMKTQAGQEHASENVSDADALLIFPNPALDRVNIVWQGKEEAPIVVEVFDMLGHRLHRFEGKGYVREQVEANKFLPGIYLVSAVTKGEITKERLIIE